MYLSGQAASELWTGVHWNDRLDRGGVVVSDDVYLTLDVEAVED